MFEKYIEQILKIFRYVDSALITDDKGIIRYYYTGREDLNRLEKERVIGKHILDVYTNLNDSSSTVMEVIRTRKPVLNMKQELKTGEDNVVHAITSTLPIMEGSRLMGTIDVSSYAEESMVISTEMIKKDRELYTLSDIVSLSDDMVELKEKIQRVSNTDSSVLIYGETGTGKELVAQSIHTAGKRKNRPFIVQNCSAIPSTLLESILFGTVKGSFTGAEDRKGLLEMADKGTLFLDEINSMELSVQGKLLKAIEEKQFTRVGGSKPVHVDVKIISASNRVPEACVEEKTLRSDLLYRLSVVRLNIPPLRERMIDIAPLVSYFIKLYNYKMERNIVDLEDEVYRLFNGYSWPGNVRELRSAIESAFNLTPGRFIGLSDLPEYLVDAMKAGAESELYNIDFSKSLKEMMEEYELYIIKKALSQSRNKAEAAAKLQTTKQLLNYKIKKYGIEK